MRPIALKLNLGLDKTEYWREDSINIDPISKVPLGLHTSYLRADYDDLDHYFEPDSVDTVRMNDVTAKLSIDQLRRTLAQIVRLLHPGGYVYVDRRTGDIESTSVSYFIELIQEFGFRLLRTRRDTNQRIWMKLGKI